MVYVREVPVVKAWVVGAIGKLVRPVPPKAIERGVVRLTVPVATSGPVKLVVPVKVLFPEKVLPEVKIAKEVSGVPRKTKVLVTAALLIEVLEKEVTPERLIACDEVIVGGSNSCVPEVLPKVGISPEVETVGPTIVPAEGNAAGG